MGGELGGSVDLHLVQPSTTEVTHASAVANGLSEGWLV